MKYFKQLIILINLCITTLILGADFKNLMTEDIKKVIQDPNYIIIDARISSAYNGWPLDGLKNGGHIDNSVNFAAQWLKVDLKQDAKEKKIIETLINKKILKEKNIILYDANGKDAKEVGEFLVKKGYKNISIYDIKKWDEENLPLKKLPNYEILVPAVWVNEVINKKEFKVFEVAWGPEEQDKDYIEGHLKGAVHIDTDEIEQPPLWSINDDKLLLEFAKNNGISKDDKVILYSTNPMPSYRIATILKYLGVKDVRVLDGGLSAWKLAGFQLEKKSNKKNPNNGFGSEKPLNKNYIVNINEAKTISKKENGQLVDIRSWDEHIGKISGYSDIDYKGRPQYSIWGKAGTDANNLDDYRNIDNTMKSGEEILAMWKELGIDFKKELSFFCGSGWRAAEVFIFSKVLGLEKTSLYSNGWYEWGFNKQNPIELGEPKSKK